MKNDEKSRCELIGCHNNYGARCARCKRMVCPGHFDVYRGRLTVVLCNDCAGVGVSVAIAQINETYNEIAAKDAHIKRLEQWVADLQSGMYVNCVYCGHRYGPNDETPTSMAGVLREHVEQCPAHPLSAAMKTIAELREQLAEKSQ